MYEVLNNLLWHTCDEVCDFIIGLIGLFCRLCVIILTLKLLGTFHGIAEANFDVFLHQFIAQSLDFVVHGSRYEINFDFVAPVFLFAIFIVILIALQELVRALFLNQVETLIHLLFKTNIKHAIRFVENQVLQIVKFQALGILQMV